MTQVFISYSRKDLPFVAGFAADLRAVGLDVWYDLSGLDGGARWRIEIEKAIRASQYIIVVLSPDSVISTWVEEEIMFARDLGRKIIPLLYRPCDLPLGYRTIHIIDVRRGKFKQNFQEILDAMGVVPAPPPEPVSDPDTPDSEAAQRIRDVFELLTKSWKTGLLAFIPAILLIVFGVSLYTQIFAPPVFFFCGSINNAHVCEYTDNKDEIKTVPDLDDAINWAPVKSFFGDIYFASDRNGDTEIYRLKNNGDIERVTDSSGDSKSWSPAVRYDGTLYFTSNRSGKAEIYRLKRNGDVERVTNTPGAYESWSPVVGFATEVYFTSDRSGKTEVYRLLGNGKVERVTNTPAGYESWSPAYMLGGGIYFTSNRDGKSELYRLNRIGGIERVTNTTGISGSWSPLIRGRSVYFTSSRSGQTQVYLLKSQVTSILSFEGWTNVNEVSPFYKDK